MSRHALPTPAEWKVIRWTFVPAALAALAALVYMAHAYLERRADCASHCEQLGAPRWELRMNAGGRFNLGTHCVCHAAKR